MSTAAMEAFFSATKQQPQSEAELQSVLAELPRRELQALSKAHGVKATLKRESLVEMLVRAIKEKLWPSAATVEEKEKDEKEKEDGGKGEETEAVVGVEAVEGEKKAPVKKNTAAKTVAVGKKAALERKTPSTSESPKAKGMKGASVKVSAKATSPSVVLEKLHAKEIAKQPTLLQHDKAKKERAAVLLSTSKFSVVKKTRSKTKELADAAAAASAADKSVTKTLRFGARTPVKQKPPVSAPAVLPTQKEAKKGSGYKPYVGKLPAFEGDSLFSPKKKEEPRPAPMSVAVMKAARVATPRKATTTPVKKATTTPVKKATTTPVKKATSTPVKKMAPTPTKTTELAPTKKPTVAVTKVLELAKKNPATSSANKENSTPPASSPNSAEKTKVVVKNDKAPMTKSAVSKVRTSVKSSTLKAVASETKKNERRAKFTQDAKTKSSTVRNQARRTPSVPNK